MFAKKQEVRLSIEEDMAEQASIAAGIFTFLKLTDDCFIECASYIANSFDWKQTNANPFDKIFFIGCLLSNLYPEDTNNRQILISKIMKHSDALGTIATFVCVPMSGIENDLT